MSKTEKTPPKRIKRYEIYYNEHEVHLSLYESSEQQFQLEIRVLFYGFDRFDENSAGEQDINQETCEFVNCAVVKSIFTSFLVYSQTFPFVKEPNCSSCHISKTEMIQFIEFLVSLFRKLIGKYESIIEEEEAENLIAAAGIFSEMLLEL